MDPESGCQEKAMLVFKVERPPDRVRELANIIVQAVAELEKAVAEMRDRIDRKWLMSHCAEINRLENHADSVYRAAKAELFAREEGASLIRWREIYDNMEKVIDKCEDAANVLEGVALKYA